MDTKHLEFVELSDVDDRHVKARVEAATVKQVPSLRYLPLEPHEVEHVRAMNRAQRRTWVAQRRRELRRARKAT